jgi:GTP-binding protein YchF
VLRCFDDPNVVHVDGSINPVRDKEIIDAELQLKDLETVDQKVKRVEKAAKSGNDKEAKKAYDALSKIKAALEAGRSARTVQLTEEEQAQVADCQLLTVKPVMYVCNVDVKSVKTGNKYVDAVREAVKDEHAEVLVITAQMESEIAALETYEERQMFLADMGLDEPGVNKLIKAAYRLLNLQTYFTAGVKEVRAWTITKGMSAPQAAGVIHTDFEKGFIKAEVIKYDDFLRYGSESACRDNGKLAIEGKEYIVQDGDIMHFRFNV